jgi:hypothetical protein
VDIRLEAKGHVYGATLFHLLQALPLRSATKILKVNLVTSEKSEVTHEHLALLVQDSFI